MIRNLLPYLLSSEVKTYHYAVPKEIIIEKISTIFSKSGKPLSDPDIEGCFTNGDAFQISVNSVWVTPGNAKFGSILFGTISAADNGETIIKTVTHVRFPLKLIAFVMPLLGLAYSYKAIRESSLQFGLIAAAMILLVPFICNWFGGVSTATIRERFTNYFDKEINKTNVLNTGFTKNRL